MGQVPVIDGCKGEVDKFKSDISLKITLTQKVRVMLFSKKRPYPISFIQIFYKLTYNPCNYERDRIAAVIRNSVYI